MIETTLGEIAAWAGGALDLADPATPVDAPAAADSRQVVPGGLFVAIVGERVDGHDYARRAIDAGAVACLTSRPVGVPAIVVDDPTAALGRVAGAVLERLDGCSVVGLTGSQGKTTTKDLLAQVLARRGPTVAPVGSYNTEIGVPLTVLRADRDTRYLVIEMGARGKGHIAYLCDMTRPKVGLVLNVGLAHVGGFGSREGIAAAKGELVESLPSDGVAVLNADDPLVREMAGRTKARVMTFGEHPDADVRIDDVTLDPIGRPRFALTYAGATAPVELRLLSRYQAANAAAAAGVALSLGMELADISEALSEAGAASRWRMEPHERADGVLVLNDAYNANPDSMRAALDTTAGIVGNRQGRGIAVLGPMRELGSASEEAHREIGGWAVERGIDTVVVVGEDARSILLGAEAAGVAEAVLVPDGPSAVEWLDKRLRSGDVVLVKASRADGLERVAHALTASAGNTASESAAAATEGEGSTDAQ
ncbi:MAG TPA: UDP-N-acetylmuramoyl-tripeptide--D-alanyl-D-alanine ligase [Nocardioidaceae bacterium]|nr:UDP-N-acetylmuramoyl-tripeptide--D-alanyl-D-alanine ligase [Nocardioidaceae bacterium]